MKIMYAFVLVLPGQPHAMWKWEQTCGVHSCLLPFGFWGSNSWFTGKSLCLLYLASSVINNLQGTSASSEDELLKDSKWWAFHTGPGGPFPLKKD